MPQKNPKKPPRVVSFETPQSSELPEQNNSVPVSEGKINFSSIMPDWFTKSRFKPPADPLPPIVPLTALLTDIPDLFPATNPSMVNTVAATTIPESESEESVDAKALTPAAYQPEIAELAEAKKQKAEQYLASLMTLIDDIRFYPRDTQTPFELSVAECNHEIGVLKAKMAHELLTDSDREGYLESQAAIQNKLPGIELTIYSTEELILSAYLNRLDKSALYQQIQQHIETRPLDEPLSQNELLACLPSHWKQDLQLELNNSRNKLLKTHKIIVDESLLKLKQLQQEIDRDVAAKEKIYIMKVMVEKVVIDYLNEYATRSLSYYENKLPKAFNSLSSLMPTAVTTLATTLYNKAPNGVGYSRAIMALVNLGYPISEEQFQNTKSSRQYLLITAAEFEKLQQLEAVVDSTPGYMQARKVSEKESLLALRDIFKPENSFLQSGYAIDSLRTKIIVQFLIEEASRKYFLDGIDPNFALFISPTNAIEQTATAVVDEKIATQIMAKMGGTFFQSLAAEFKAEIHGEIKEIISSKLSASLVEDINADKTYLEYSQRLFAEISAKASVKLSETLSKALSQKVLDTIDDGLYLIDNALHQSTAGTRLSRPVEFSA